MKNNLPKLIYTKPNRFSKMKTANPGINCITFRFFSKTQNFQYIIIAFALLCLSNNFKTLAQTPAGPSLSPEAAPNAPSNLTIRSFTNGIDLHWDDNANNEKGFYIERRIDTAINFTKILTTGMGIRTYRDNVGLKIDTTYYYRVQAFNNDGVSDFSNVANGYKRNKNIGLDDFSFIQNVKIFPNPNNGILNLEMGSQLSSISTIYIKVQNLLGETIFSEEQKGIVKREINLMTAPAGVYFLYLQVEGKKFSKILLLNK